MLAALHWISFSITRIFQKDFSLPVSRMPTREFLGTCDAK
jgi:hypothetical protein